MRLGHILLIYSSRILKNIILNCSRTVQHCGEDISLKWKIENGMLYLIEIDANVTGVQSQEHIKCQESTTHSLLSDEAVDMDYFFPNQSKVFADWYSGELPVHYENSTKEESKYLIFTIDKGYVIGQEQVTEQEYFNYPYNK